MKVPEKSKVWFEMLVAHCKQQLLQNRVVISSSAFHKGSEETREREREEARQTWAPDQALPLAGWLCDFGQVAHPF